MKKGTYKSKHGTIKVREKFYMTRQAAELKLTEELSKKARMGGVKRGSRRVWIFWKEEGWICSWYDFL